MVSNSVSNSQRSLKFAALALGAVVLSLGISACGKNKGKVSFGNLQDGAQVESPFTVTMNAENLVVEPASAGITEGHGHFHILVDVPVAMNLDPVAKDAQHIHYGDGQSEAVLDLPVGQHTLTLQFAKGDHRPYDPQITQQITINVTKRNMSAEEAAAAAAAESEAAMGSGSGSENGGAAGSATKDATGKDTVNKTPNVNIQAAPSMGGAGGSGGR